jgi:hypothetical protein
LGSTANENVVRTGDDFVPAVDADHGLTVRSFPLQVKSRALGRIIKPTVIGTACKYKRQLMQEDQTDRRASRKRPFWSQNDRAARLAAIPAGESPANRGVQSLL